eukprot:CAMPEP_0201480934 /NCGR_PEP_ID=MMETSP0151_2-20130828/5297_1 /ASSEMBLY_ACC=CAM_ASM_000257 /TAXON_ID=200890 /ORGANISM="Paramoeba atlantica, Strain 621/1 / CCAP 1560/9" /LENGTH=99 /DNA_ID=CAMNT_0047862931 /DNA_START=81 /DNA_END=380 /DNA_ORIENTATION=+
MSMYVRAKRHKYTVFLYCDPSDKASSLKEQIISLKIDDRTLPFEKIRLYKDDRAPLDDDKTLEESKIENDGVIFFCFKIEGTEAWEDIDVQNVGASAAS